MRVRKSSTSPTRHFDKKPLDAFAGREATDVESEAPRVCPHTGVPHEVRLHHDPVGGKPG